LWKTKHLNASSYYPDSIAWRDNSSVYLGGYGLSMLWTPSNNTRLHYIKNYAYTNYDAKWSPNTELLLSGNFIWRFDAPPSEQYSPTPANAIELQAFVTSNVAKAWKPDGTEVLLGTDCYQSPNQDPFIIYSATTGQKIRTLIARTSSWDWYCNAQAHWISETRIILGNRLVDATTGDVLMMLEPVANRTRQNRYAISQDGSKIAQISLDTNANQFYLEWYSTVDFAFLGDMAVLPNSDTIKWLPDGIHIAISGYSRPFVIYNTNTKSVEAEAQLHLRDEYDFEFSPDQKSLVTKWNSSLYLWDTTDLQNPQSWELVQYLGSPQEPHTANVYSLALVNPKTLSSVGRDGNLMRFQTQFGAALKRSLVSSQAIYALSYSSDGTTYATAGEDSTTHLWNSATREEIGTLNGHTYTVRNLAWKPNSSTLASAGWDDTVRIWNTSTQSLEQTQTDHTDYVNAVQYNPNGTHLASASSDGTIKLRHPDTGQTQYTLIPQDSSSPVFTLAYSSNGVQLASGSEDHRVRIWDTTTQTLTGTLKGHLGAVRSVVWLNATTLITGGMDGRIIVWDVPNQKLLLEVKPDLGAIFALTAASDGKTFYAGFDSGNLAAWKVTP
jgi:WD40 repeat protein